MKLAPRVSTRPVGLNHRGPQFSSVLLREALSLLLATCFAKAREKKSRRPTWRHGIGVPQDTVLRNDAPRCTGAPKHE